jgi:hypothetical protein
VLGQLKKIKFSLNTLESMVKANGETFPKEQVRYIYRIIESESKKKLNACFFFFGFLSFYMKLMENCTGLKRCGKSCRLRWLNYLRPDIKRGNISPDEEELIIRLHKLLGNR